MRGRRAVAVLASIAVVAAGSAALSAGGGDASARAGLQWDGAPRVVGVPELPDDRVLAGRVRNASEEELHLEAAGVELLDARGRALESTARFAAAFGHGLYSPTDPPDEVAENEQRRLGEIVTLAPGESAPLTLSWRLRPGGAPPAVARVDGMTLRLPSGR